LPTDYIIFPTVQAIAYRLYYILIVPTVQAIGSGIRSDFEYIPTIPKYIYNWGPDIGSGIRFTPEFEDIPKYIPKPEYKSKYISKYIYNLGPDIGSGIGSGIGPGIGPGIGSGIGFTPESEYIPKYIFNTRYSIIYIYSTESETESETISDSEYNLSGIRSGIGIRNWINQEFDCKLDPGLQAISYKLYYILIVLTIQAISTSISIQPK
jgi:hypothetical protein